MLALGKWPQLAELRFELIDERSSDSGCHLERHGFVNANRRSDDDIRALTSGSWPHLQTLAFDNFPIIDTDIPALLQASWPELTSLIMLGIFEATESITLCMQGWPQLKSLTLGAPDMGCVQALTLFAESTYPILDILVYDMPFTHILMPYP